LSQAGDTPDIAMGLIKRVCGGVNTSKIEAGAIIEKREKGKSGMQKTSEICSKSADKATAFLS